MRRVLVLLVGILALLAPAAAGAHPLGNFTVNHFTRIVPSGDRLYLLYVLDMAEIPTFQERGELERLGEDAYARGLAVELASGIGVSVDGSPVELEVLERAIAFPEGAGGLPTTRLELVLDAGRLPDGGPVEIRFRDGNDAGRVGWREIVVAPQAGARVLSASVPSESRSDELRAYPETLLESPLDLREASARVEAGGAADPAPALTGSGPAASVAREEGGGFASLVRAESLSIGVVVASIFLAMFWGAVHALSPGHGKAIVAAYLIGTRGTARDAVSLGAIVTVTHTIGVFALGLVTLALSEFIVPDDLYPWLNLAAAVLVVGVGIAVLRMRLRDWLRGRRATPRAAEPHGHDHDHDHDHDHGHDHGGHAHDHRHGNHGHDHGHRHGPAPGTGWRGLLGVGISGGLLPCPSALVVLLAAISLQRVGYGLVLIVAFSLGLAATISAIGLVAISARRTLRRLSFQGPIVRALPAISALAILAFGVAMTVRALPALT